MPRLSKIGAAALAAFGWTSGVSTVTATYLVVAGGGGGGGRIAGGGGAGGFRTSTLSLNPTLSYTVTVGSGGSGGTNTGGSGTRGTSGSDSVFSTITSTGGGGGGNYGSNDAGLTGGSGGGGSGLTGAGGSGTSGQGNSGGTGSISGNISEGGGGGGATAAGSNGDATGSGRGNGGAGTASSISGSSVTYAGGGGGGAYFTAAVAGDGGAGGGGAGSIDAGATGGTGTTTPAAGTANTGGGGGGNGVNASGNGGNGGSGIVIISYAGAQRFGGGVVTSSGGNTIHTFTTSGTLVPITPLSANYLVVAGGGGSAGVQGGADTGSGGGGAGGLLSGSGLIIDANSIYTVTVGAGGTAGASGGANGTSGGNSTVFSISATGGGASRWSPSTGLSGGSGAGGTGGNNIAGGAGTSGQGNAGGLGTTDGVNASGGGGGGGAGAVGSNGSGVSGGNGGAGTASSISGSSVTYAGGGGGAGGRSIYTQGTGGSGGGGGAGQPGTAGTANRGGGGGGSNGGTTGGYSNQPGAAGGSGIVIISYAGATQLMAGGTVTISGGNVIHTFTSTGFLAPIDFVGNSLRFRSSATAYLSRTPTVAGNRTTWTWSGWLKLGQLATGTNQAFFGAGDGSTGTYLQAFFDGTTQSLTLNALNSSAVVMQKISSSIYRDPAAWYHVQFAYDSTQATSTNRIKIYVNGVQLTSFSTNTDPALNTQTLVNSTSQHTLSSLNYSPRLNYFDGYQAEVNFIDGQALTPSSFGTFNSYGVWQPITYGGSYGTNGFYLPFTNATSTTTLGFDFSPNGNNWTTNNISLTAGATYDSMTDVPTLTSATAANYCVMNPLDKGANSVVASGNLNISSNNGTRQGIKGSFGVSTGKWYFEYTKTTTASASVGVASAATGFTADSNVGDSATSWGYLTTGNKLNNNTSTSYGASWTTNDVIGVALDMDAGTITFYKNNSSQGQAFSGLTGTVFPMGYNGSATADIFNFGQRPFAYTPPSGFLALNTFNL